LKAAAMPDITIRPGSIKDAPAIAAFCQPIYAAVYPNAKYRVKPEHFSPEIFRTQDTLNYFAAKFSQAPHRRPYVAEQDGRIVGCISIERGPYRYEMLGFYVAPELQGQGLGKRLFAKALEFATDDVPIRGEVAETNTKAIAMYERWGFKHAPHHGVNLRHWQEWPDGLHNGYIFMEAHAKDIHV
jgi:ribosomal protein S18 acetylase RimI-like enzyme